MGYFKQIAIEQMENERLAHEAKLLAEFEAEERIYKEMTDKTVAENKAYEEQWPNHCKTCGGWGIVSWTENQSPLGSGCYWPMEMSDPCGDCYAAGRCGRCGGELPMNEDEEPTDHCPTCGWESGKDGIQRVY